MSDTLPEGQQLIIDTTGKTLRQVAEWGHRRVERAVLIDIAGEIEAADIENWICCPMCEEMDCDDDCALRPIRVTYESAVER